MVNKAELSAVTASEAADASNKASGSKRKKVPKVDEDDDSGSDSGSDVSMINVDFDFYNLNPDVDQIAVKRFLRQTLSADDELVDVHPLASLVLDEGVRMGIGSSIKTEGEESDPWGLLTALEIPRNAANSSLVPFLDYLRAAIPPKSPLRPYLDPSPPASSTPALLFSLRLLNLPLPLIPPLYKMLLTELAAAESAGRSPPITHFILWGRGYRLEGAEQATGLEMDVDAPAQGAGGGKKKRKSGATSGPAGLATGAFAYHPEEEFVDKFATLVQTYEFRGAQKREEDAFGVEQFGRVVLIDREGLRKAVEAMEAACQ